MRCLREYSPHAEHDRKAAASSEIINSTWSAELDDGVGKTRTKTQAQITTTNAAIDNCHSQNSNKN